MGLTFWRGNLCFSTRLGLEFSYLIGTGKEIKIKIINDQIINSKLHLLCSTDSICFGFNSLSTTTNYFDLYTAHNVSHLFTEAIVSDNYSSQQDKRHVGQRTRGTICCINNTPCQPRRLSYGWMSTAKMEPVSDASLCSIRVVTLSLFTVRNLSDLIQKNGL